MQILTRPEPHAAAAELRASLELQRAAYLAHPVPTLAERNEDLKRIAAFVRRQRRSLRNALNYTGHEAHDRSGVEQTLRGEAIVPRAAIELVRERARANHDMLVLRPGDDHDRAYYVVASSRIALDAVASLRASATTESEQA